MFIADNFRRACAPLQIEKKLEELGELEPAILENQAKLDACDIICYTYDSSDPNSFSHIVELRVCWPFPRCPLFSLSLYLSLSLSVSLSHASTHTRLYSMGKGEIFGPRILSWRLTFFSLLFPVSANTHTSTTCPPFMRHSRPTRTRRRSTPTCSRTTTRAACTWQRRCT